MSFVESVTFQIITISYLPISNNGFPVGWLRIRFKRGFQPLLFVWLMASLLLCQAYMTNLLAHLVKIEHEKPPETFQVGKGSAYQ